jgi:hypothetical protein
MTTIYLKLDSGTLFATPNAGHVRARQGTAVALTAGFPFTVEISALTGSGPAPSVGDCCSTAGGYSVTVSLPTLPDVPDPPAAPSYKYTIKGDGEAAGKVLDPIIIVDRR